MFPGSRNMDPHTQPIPHLREHSPSPYHYHPNWEQTPLHTKADSFKHPSGFESWPYGGKIEHNGCCNHGYPPGYYSYRPPYFPFQHPPQMYYPPGPYPPYPDSYPPYFVPPPYYATFDYDKDRNHCCGCPNHVCHRKEGSSVKIEEEQTTPKTEEEPDKGPKDIHNGLMGLPSSHNPWVSGNSAWKGKAEKSSQSLPVLDFHDKFKNLQQGLGDTTFKGDDKFSQLPYPIYWLPHSHKPEDPVRDKKEAYASPNLNEEWPSIFRRSPLKLLDNENPLDKAVITEEVPNIQNSKDGVTGKERKIRTIPVVHLESENEKLSMPGNPDEENKRSKSVSEEKCDVSMKKDSTKKQQVPVKTSKLPPVCLRVDPLPKKNASNGKARPLSSPGCKEKGKINKDNSERANTINNVGDKTPDKDVVVIDVKEISSGEKSNETGREIVSGQGMEGIIEKSDHMDGKKSAIDADVEVKGETNDFSIIQQLKIDQDKEKADTLDNKINNSKVKKKKKNFSPDDAALLVQSAYRGFNVRRWQPLEKLRKIERIRGEVSAVNAQIQNYEASPKRNVKQREVISEAIMNLLLQLDAIQGLLPSLREVRKAVARELVLLQEKLDQLSDQAADQHHQGTEKKDEGFNPASETISGQPFQYSAEENVSEHEIEQKTAVLDNKTSCALEQDDGVDDELVPSGTKYDQTPQNGNDDDDDGKGNISPSNSGKVSSVEKSIGEDVFPPPDHDATGIDLRRQPEENFTCNELLEKEVKFDTQEVLPLKPDEGSRPSQLEEAATIKDDEIAGERDGELIVEEGVVAGEVERLENYVLDPVLSSTMNPNQAGDAEVAETQKLSSVKNQSGSDESPAAESSVIFNDQGDANCLDLRIVPVAEPVCCRETSSPGSAMVENGVKEVNEKIDAISTEGKPMSGEPRDGELSINEKKLVGENAELRQMLESLLHAGREQMRVISDMNDRVRNLERRVSRKKKMRVNHNKVSKPSHEKAAASHESES